MIVPEMPLTGWYSGRLGSTAASAEPVMRPTAKQRRECETSKPFHRYSSKIERLTRRGNVCHRFPPFRIRS